MFVAFSCSYIDVCPSVLLCADQSLPAVRQAATGLPAGGQTGPGPSRAAGAGGAAGGGGGPGLGHAEHLPPVAVGAPRQAASAAAAAAGPAQRQVTLPAATQQEVCGGER